MFTDYEILVQKMDQENKEIICIGDFNCDWLPPETSETKNLSDLANSCQLVDTRLDQADYQSAFEFNK